MGKITVDKTGSESNRKDNEQTILLDKSRCPKIVATVLCSNVYI